MSSATLLDVKPSRLEALKNLRHWAFPHWILWATVLAISSINALWASLSNRFTMQDQLFTADLVIAFVAMSFMAFRMLKSEVFNWFLHRLWAFLLSLFMAVILMSDLQIFSHLIMSTNLPMADDALMHWDHSLGFDWLAYAKMRVRSLEVFYLVIATALICIIIAAGFPARATMDLLGDEELRARLSLLGDNVGAIHVQQMMELRGTAPIYLSPDNLQGLVSFPSFHTCMALIIAWCSRGRWYTLLIGSLIAITIIAGTPVFGGHYLVDVIGGVAVTAAAIWFWMSKIQPHISHYIADTTEKSLPLPRLLNRIISK
jgi:membrane-associated phospholipid phosphatase